MTDILTDEDLRTEAVKATEPPKRWRCRWWIPVTSTLFCKTCLQLEDRGAGESLSCRSFPSKEIADEAALDLIKSGACNMHYLGTVPEDAA